MAKTCCLAKIMDNKLRRTLRFWNPSSDIFGDYERNNTWRLSRIMPNNSTDSFSSNITFSLSSTLSKASQLDEDPSLASLSKFSALINPSPPF